MKKNSLIFIVFILAGTLYAQVAPKNILLNKCFFSYTTHYPYLKGNKAFAYVRVPLGEEDYCTWSHKASSVENARNSALNACKQQHIDAECKIVDVDNTWLVQEGDFSSITPPDNTPLSQKQYTTLTNKAQDIVLGECLVLFDTHMKDKGHKVFAYTVDEAGRYACGTTHEYQTLRQAALDALKRCEETKRSMGQEAPKHPCLSFSDGKNILANVHDYNLTLHKKTNKFLNIKSYQSYVERARKYFSGPCLAQYKYYLRVKDHRAFYIAKDSEGKIVCGHSFGQFTIASAKKYAYEKCKTSAKFKKINAKCTLYNLDLLSDEELEKKRILK